jgi:hypothetical protein
MVDVKCTVNNCHYWSKGNKCEANQILVTSDKFANYAPTNVDATRANTLSATPTSTCMETACKTFVSDSEARSAKRSDDVLKQQRDENRLH